MVQGGPVIQVAIIVATVVGLWIGARLLVDAAVRLARRFGLSDLTIGLTIVALGTSTPELAVSVDAAFKGLGDIAIANVLGSNIYNVAFILGVLSLVKVIPIADSLVHRDGLALLASILVGGLAIFDPESINTIVIPRACPATARWLGDANNVSSLLLCFPFVKSLHKAKPPDETGLVRHLCLLNSLVQLYVRQMLNGLEPTYSSHHGEYAG